MQSISTVISEHVGNLSDAAYITYLQRIQERLTNNIKVSFPLFTTDAQGLWETYLSMMPEVERQYHNCNTCKSFIHRYGGLVTIDESGKTESAIWNAEDADDGYKSVIAELARKVRRAKVTGVFLSSEKVWGHPVTGQWRHFAVVPPVVYKETILTAGQAMAEKAENFKTVMRALNDFTLPIIDQALTLLRTESLYRSEKVLGQAEWLRKIHAARDTVFGSLRANIVWRFVSTAPPGFCHPRASMIGTLLEDIASGMDFNAVSKRFAEKMHPLQYLRPQAAPAKGNIAQAEKIIAVLKAAGSLDRRFARIDDLVTIWKPKSETLKPDTGNGVFSHLKTKDESVSISKLKVPLQTMTWVKFSETILPTAEAIEFFCHTGNDNYTALLTAVRAEAPPILQWDNADCRNPVSWYVYNGGSLPSQWGLIPGYNQITAVTLKPSMWHSGFDHQGEGVVFVIKDAIDSRESGNAIFPETLKSEFHSIRATIEAYSRSASLYDRDKASACGIMLRKGTQWNAKFRVKASGQWIEYKLDRWD